MDQNEKNHVCNFCGNPPFFKHFWNQHKILYRPIYFLFTTTKLCLRTEIDELCNDINLPSSSLIPSFLNGLKRLYGVLFYEKEDALNEKRTDFADLFYVEEWCMSGPGSLDEASRVKPIMIPSTLTHPGLAILWQDMTKRAISPKRAMQDLCVGCCFLS